MRAALRHRRALYRAGALTKRTHRSLFGALFGRNEGDRHASEAALQNSTKPALAYTFALLQYVSMNEHPKNLLQSVLANNSGFLMGHVLMGASQCLYPMVHQDSLDAVMRLQIAQALACEAMATERDKLHVAALAALTSGRYREAAAVYETILLHTPTDLLAQRCAFDIYMLLGDYKNVLTTVTRRLPSWSPNEKGFSHLLGMHAYGQYAVGRLDAAEVLAERAMSINANDRWAFHTMLHILEARGNANNGATFASQHKEEFDKPGPLEQHLYFQWALYYLDLGRLARVERLLDVNILPLDHDEERPSVRALCDATHLFWRLRFVDHESPDLEKRLVEKWTAIAADEREDRACFPLFSRLLRFSILCSHGDDGESIMEKETPEDCSVDTTDFAVRNGVQLIQFSFPGPPGELATVYGGVCRGFLSFAKNQFQDAVDALLPIRGRLHVLGGTSVDHELIELLLIESASKCKDLRLAHMLLSERVSERPQSAQAWSAFSSVFASMGDTAAMQDAQSMSLALGLAHHGHHGA